jgi:glycerol-3-phosphate dehydrogenase (NAD(P)+)
MNIGILGAGAWGTALAIALSERPELRIRLWARDATQVARMRAQGENTRYLPGCRLPQTLRLDDDLAQTLSSAELLILAVPLAGLRPLLRQLAARRSRTPFLWLCKGLEAQTGLLPHQVVEQTLDIGIPYGALTGPSFALEVARGLPTALTLAATDEAFARRIARVLHGGHLRIYANTDLIGAEVGGAVKNILAIAAGICDGLGLGHNARAALLTRGLAEMTRFGVALGARRDTFTGLAGLGDLLLTCTGDLSRNRRVGLLLAEGRALDDITRGLGHVAEGVPATGEVARHAETLGIEMPITRAVAAVLAGQATPRQAAAQLMARDARAETDGQPE